ncbi:hypothetical protein [Thermococcus piezophilus]|nr:hypothetical protein [Thermococcus piezophilus]
MKAHHHSHFSRDWSNFYGIPRGRYRNIEVEKFIERPRLTRAGN